MLSKDSARVLGEVIEEDSTQDPGQELSEDPAQVRGEVLREDSVQDSGPELSKDSAQVRREDLGQEFAQDPADELSQDLGRDLWEESPQRPPPLNYPPWAISQAAESTGLMSHARHSPNRRFLHRVPEGGLPRRWTCGGIGLV